MALAASSAPLIARLDRALADPNRLLLAKGLVFGLCLWPMAALAWAIIADPLALGANPAETIIRELGDWTLRLLLIGLAVTPLRLLLGFNALIKVRRMVGLFAFAFCVLHLFAYLGFDRLFQWGEIIDDVIKRPFIAVGMIAFVLMLPLAITSTRAWVLRLGGAQWSLLHRLVYPVTALGVLHHWWLVKRDLTWPIIYALVLGIELLLRLPRSKELLKRYSPFRHKMARS
jgi:sulfoxide reductase heme-binding subunit YedZ